MAHAVAVARAPPHFADFDMMRGGHLQALRHGALQIADARVAYRRLDFSLVIPSAGPV